MSLIPTQITDELADVLRTCTTSRGYTSNVGATVHVGQLRGAHKQAPAIFVVPGRQSGDVRYGEVREVTREYVVRAFADLRDHPTLAEEALVDQVIWDVRRAIEAQLEVLLELAQRVRYIGDQPGYHEEGGTIVGAALSYEIQYLVNINDPETAA